LRAPQNALAHSPGLLLRPFMNRVSPLLGKIAAVAVLAACIGCESPEANGHKKKKVVTAEEFDAANGGVSGLPWNRPRAFESGAGMGKMMPQTR
jgi:hypothetical protein